MPSFKRLFSLTSRQSFDCFCFFLPSARCMRGATTTVVRWVRAPQPTSPHPAEYPAACRTKWPSASSAARRRLWQSWTTERWVANSTTSSSGHRDTHDLPVGPAGLRLGLQWQRATGTGKQREPAHSLSPRSSAGLMCATGMRLHALRNVYFWHISSKRAIKQTVNLDLISNQDIIIAGLSSTRLVAMFAGLHYIYTPLL